MQRTEPKVFLIGETRVDTVGLHNYLDFIGASDWQSDAGSDAELITEVYSRSCYNSFDVALNANLTRVREGNAPHLANIIKVGHGSVTEHAVTNWMFCKVSRVFTHELVRHRVGTAFSQESLRFVRLTDLGLWLPPQYEDDPKIKALFEKTFESLEQIQLDLAEAFDLDNPEKDFAEKKKHTSFMRRLAPIGLSTNIGFSVNHRTLRHLLVMRTSRHAEVEIRKVFSEVGRIARDRWANLYEDFKIEIVDGFDEYTTANNKI